MAEHDDPQVRPVAALWQELTRACPLAGDGCPAPAELAAFARGELGGSRRDALAQLVGNCATCARGVQLALAADAALHAPEPAPSAVVIPLRPRAAAPSLDSDPAGPHAAPRWLLGMAAALVLAALAGVWLRAPAPPGLDEPRRGGVESGLVPAPEAQVVNPVQFSWPPETGSSCRVQLRDHRGALVFESAAVAGGVQAAPAALEPGRYRWTLLCDGAPPRGPHAFTVRS